MLIIKSMKGPEFSLKHAIHTRLAGIEKPRPHFPLRASDLLKDDYEFCPREHMFMDMGLAQKKGSFVGTALRMTYDHGHYMEDKIRNEYVRDMVVGYWVCGVCENEHPHFGFAPTGTCPNCKWGKHWQYKEPRFHDPETDVSGGSDILLDIKKPKLRLVELKTMSINEFKDLVAPLAEHKQRTTLYLHLASLDPSPHAKRVATDTANILYAVKAFGVKDETLKPAGIKDAAFSPFKEYLVKSDPKLNRTPLSKAKVIKVWRDEKKAHNVPCGVCANQFTKRAQSCPAGTACWSGKYAPTLTWLEGGKPRHAGKAPVLLNEMKS